MRIVNLDLGNCELELKNFYEKLAHESSSELIIVVEPRDEAMRLITDCVASRVSEEEVMSKLAEELNELSKGIPEELRRGVEVETVNALNRISEYMHAERKAGKTTPRGLSIMLNIFGNVISMVLSSHLKALGMEAKWVSAGQAGFRLVEEYEPPWSHYVNLARPEDLRNFSKGILVISGRACVGNEGNEATLKRGMGSVISILAANEFGSKEVYAPSSIGGVYTADPWLVKNAKVIPSLSYSEALELSRLGEWIVSPQAVELAEELGIRIAVSSVQEPFKRSTVIGSEEAVEKQIVKAVVSIPDMSIFTVEGAAMAGTPGVASAILGEVAKRGVSVSMISQDASEIGITLVVRDGDLDRALKGLREGFSKEGIIKRIRIQRGVAAVSAVGEGMRGRRGVAARIFSAVAEAGVNVLAIAQGSSETGISFVVLAEDAERTLKAVHDRVILGIAG
ncbi:MAG: aspartate kinase [Thermoproteota archaeon]